jgi:cytochrome c
MARRRTRKRLSWILPAVGIAALVSVLAVTATWAAKPADAKRSRFDVLVFHRTAAFTHQAIPAAVGAIKTLGMRYGFTVDATDDAGVFTPDRLAKYEALVFVHTTGNVLPESAQRDALEHYIRGGGGFFGIHAAADMGDAVREGWPFYRGLVGAAFKGHTNAHLWADQPVSAPGIVYEGPLARAPADAERFGSSVATKTWEPARVVVEEPSSPPLVGWGRNRIRADEWYGFLDNPRGRVHVLASLDEGSYTAAAGDMGPGAADHPIVWCHRFEGGRSVYTAMGHPTGVWSERKFLRHIVGGIRMAAGYTRFDC